VKDERERREWANSAALARVAATRTGDGETFGARAGWHDDAAPTGLGSVLGWGGYKYSSPTGLKPIPRGYWGRARARVCVRLMPSNNLPGWVHRSPSHDQSRRQAGAPSGLAEGRANWGRAVPTPAAGKGKGNIRAARQRPPYRLGVVMRRSHKQSRRQAGASSGAGTRPDCPVLGLDIHLRGSARSSYN